MYYLTFHAHPAFGVPVIVSFYSNRDKALEAADSLHELSNCTHCIRVLDTHIRNFKDDSPCIYELNYESME